MTKRKLDSISDKKIKIIVIAGASSGVGADCARLLSSGNSVLYLLSRSEDKLKTVSKSCHGKTHILPGDLTKEAVVTAHIKNIIKREGRIDVVIHCVGEGLIREIQDTTLAEFHKMIEINATSLFLLMKTVIPYMYLQRSGDFISISSEAGLEGFPTYSAYCAAKFAVTGLIQSVAKEARLRNVRVNMVSPGDINTPFMEKCPIDLKLMDKYGIKVCDKKHMLQSGNVAFIIKCLVELPKNVFIPNIKILPEDYI